MIRGSVAALFGLAVGSFLNVVIYRVPRGMSIVSPASACPACGASLRPLENVPLASYVVLRGRCRHCSSRISARYPLVEALTAVAFAGAFLRFARPADAAFVAAALSVLIALTFIDLDHKRVPNVISLPATAVAAAWVGVMAVITHRPGAVLVSLGSGAGGFVLLLVIALVSGGMGFGDVKLAGFIGVVCGWFGWEVPLLGLFTGFVLGGVAGVVLIAARLKSRKDAVPFAPALCAGAAFAIFAGPGPVRAWLGG